MDVAGLHLLFEKPQRAPARKTTVTNLPPQPLRLLILAAEANPDLARLLPDTLPATLLDE